MAGEAVSAEVNVAAGKPRRLGGRVAAPTAEQRFLTAMLNHAAPYMFGLLFLAVWQIAVWANGIQPYILPGPILIVETLFTDFGTLAPSLMVTLKITLEAFVVAAVGGLALGMLFTSSRWIERSLFPYAVVLQVTPIVAIAPLIIIWAKDVQLALLICAWLVAFFPVVSNAAVGLNSTDRNLVDLFNLYGASRTQSMFLLKLPAAMPFYLAGLRISGGLALIGAVVAEFVAAGKENGLGTLIVTAASLANLPVIYASVVVLAIMGIALFLLVVLVQSRVLTWHSSQTVKDR